MLNLRENKIGAKGTESISKALEKYLTITKLDLSRIHLFKSDVNR